MSHENHLRSLLCSGKPVFVRFRKMNGDLRDMICTVNPENIPICDLPKGKMVYTEAQIRVYDLVAKQWRSMKADRLVEVHEYTAMVA